ncbi:MAG: glycosyl transferase [Deltaproteobacteria bacterium]|nr:glycosyl transferase [Deltaproteobacteria bacterium]
MMKIIFYCQYVFGIGHLFRSLELVRALSNHDVALVVGGPEVEIDLPSHVKLVRLPALYMDEKYTTLIPANPEWGVAQIQHQRKKILFALFEQFRPDMFIVELFPFGRTIFGFELLPILKAIRKGVLGGVKSVCSLRDVLVEKRDPIEYEERVLHNLNELFDFLLIHSDSEFLSLDETFSRSNEINIPIFYTGFVTKKPARSSGKKIRETLGIGPEEKLIVASAGGGRSGYKLLSSVVDACHLLKDSIGVELEVFSGPFMDNNAFTQIAAKSGPGINVTRFTKHFLDYLQTADLSVSMAGYNTCMNILTTRVPALVWPFSGDQEQGLRAERLSHLGAMTVLNDGDLRPERFAAMIRQGLTGKPQPSVSIDLNGAVNTANWLESLIKQ